MRDCPAGQWKSDRRGDHKVMVDAAESNNPTTSISAEELAEVTSFRHALELAQKDGEEVNSADAVLGDGTGFDKIAKSELVGVGFLILSFDFAVDDKTNNDVVHVRVMTIDDRKVTFTDGGTGIYRQLREYADKYGNKPLAVKAGLRASNYTIEVHGETKPVTTYYLSVNARAARR